MATASPRTKIQKEGRYAGTLTVVALLERGMEYFRQRRYAEGMALLTLAGEHLPSNQLHLVTLLHMMEREYTRYVHLQQTLQEVNVRFAGAYEELEACIEAFSALEPMLHIEISDGTPLQISEHRQHTLEQDLEINEEPCPALYAICLGPFELRRHRVPITLCSNRNGQAILRYLIAQSDHSASTDTLMDLLWPDDAPEVALRKLHVTVSILRHALQEGYDPAYKYILYKHGVYQLNPSLPLRTDVEEFLALYNMGRRVGKKAASSWFERACSLYTRPFLVEDLYVDWSAPQREHLSQIYLDMCNALASHYIELRTYETAAKWATMIIKENRYDEAAYRQLMCIYALCGRRNDALKQYQRCQQVLGEELNLQPVPATQALHQAIISGEFCEESLRIGSKSIYKLNIELL